MIDKNNIKKIILILFSILICFSCSKRATIQGTIKGGKSDIAILYKILPQEKLFMDSILLIGEKCSFSIPQKEIGVYVLQFDDTSFISFIVQQGDKIKFQADKNNLNRTLQISANEETMLHWQCRQQLFTFEDNVKLLSQTFLNNQQTANLDSLNQVLSAKYDSLFGQHRQWLNNVIVNNPDNLASLMAFYQSLGRRSFFNRQEDEELLKLLYEHLQKKYPQSEYIIDLGEKLGYNE